MPNTLRVFDFTLFSAQTFEFGDGLNVFVGENDTGKSNILKGVFSLLFAGTSKFSSNFAAQAAALEFTLLRLFGISDLGQLVQRKDNELYQEKQCELILSGGSHEQLVSAHITAGNDFSACYKQPGFCTKTPIFLPGHCFLEVQQNFFSFGSAGTYGNGSYVKESVVPGFLSFSPCIEKCPTSLLKTDHELCLILGGCLMFDEDGKICLKTKAGRIRGERVVKVESLGCGLRKFAVLSLLICSGALDRKSALFWEEPETGLNPKLIRELAKVLVALVEAGVQIFISTHSLFLLRELEILDKHKEPSSRYFGFYFNEAREVFVTDGASVSDIGSIVALDEELRQSDCYLDKEASLGNVSQGE